MKTPDGIKKKDRILKGKFIYGKIDDDIVAEIIRELTAMKKTNEITSECKRLKKCIKQNK